MTRVCCQNTCPSLPYDFFTFIIIVIDFIYVAAYKDVLLMLYYNHTHGGALIFLFHDPFTLNSNTNGVFFACFPRA